MKIMKKLSAGILAVCFIGLTSFSCGSKQKTAQTEINEQETNETQTGVSTEQEQTVLTGTDKTEPTVSLQEYVKTTANVNLRSGAGTDYSVVATAEKGTSYAVLERQGNWVKTYFRGKTVYLSASYLTSFSLEKADTGVENVLFEGYKWLGTPYVYGAVRYHDGNGHLLSGFTTDKFDCSSLTQYVLYKGASQKLGTTTRSQVLQGTGVERADLRRGDLIYFTNASRYNNTGIERVGHVAIYLGDGYILHTASDYARIEKMSATRWSYYLEARRFV